MRLDLRFVARPLEDIWCPILVALAFEDPGDNPGGIGGLDARTGGYLSRLRRQGFWTGAESETLLVASRGMVKAEKILLKGLGMESGYDASGLSRCLKAAGDRRGPHGPVGDGRSFPVRPE